MNTDRRYRAARTGRHTRATALILVIALLGSVAYLALVMISPPAWVSITVLVLLAAGIARWLTRQPKPVKKKDLR